MIIKLPKSNDMTSISQLLTSNDPMAAIRILDRRIAAMAGNAQIIPFRTKSRCTVQTWPVPPQPAA